MENVISETIIYRGHVIEKLQYSRCWEITAPNNQKFHASTKADAVAKVNENVVSTFAYIRPTLVKIVDDYIAKLERDDMDPGAVGKMKEAQLMKVFLQRSV